MPLPIESFDQIVTNQVDAMQASSGLTLDFSVGSIFLAEVESNAGNSMWLQAMAQFLLAVARLQTSTGNDVDTFVQQFGLTRNPPTNASRNITLSRFTPTTQAIIKSGTLDLSSLGSLVFSTVNGVTYSVYGDTDNEYFNPALNTYILPSGISSITVPIVATTPGAIGNVIANQITNKVSIIPGIDTVTNASALTNGTDQESDSALKYRFYLYINSLSKATLLAIESAAYSVAGVVRVKVKENVNTDDTDHLGFFYVVVDDGTGNASSPLLANVQAVVDATRGLTIAFSVYAPTQVPISISAHVFTDGTIDDDVVQTAVVTALQTYISEESFDALFAWSKIPQIIYDVNAQFSTNPFSPILNVTNWLLNSGTSDVTLSGTEIGVNGTFTVTMNA